MRAAVERQNQPATRCYFTDIARQYRISGQFGELDMKRGRKPDRQRIVVAARLLLGIDMVFQRLDLLARKTAGQSCNHQTFKPDADVEDIARLVPAWGRHRGAAVAPQLDQPLRRKPRQCRANDGAAGAELLADGVFGKLGAGLQRLFDDGMPERLVNDAAAIGRRSLIVLCHRQGTLHQGTLRRFGCVIATSVSGMQFSGGIGSYVGSGLNSTKHGRNILFEAYEMLAAEQDCRAAALPGLDHQNIVNIYQNLPCRRPRSFQCNKNSQSGLPFRPASSRATPYSLAIRPNAFSSSRCRSISIIARMRKSATAVYKRVGEIVSVVSSRTNLRLTKRYCESRVVRRSRGAG